MWRNQQAEKPMSSDEINEKAQKMMAERARQDAELRRKYESRKKDPGAFFHQEVPLNKHEIDAKVREMMHAREKQDQDSRRLYSEAYRTTYRKEPPAQGISRSVLQDQRYLENLDILRSQERLQQEERGPFFSKTISEPSYRP